MQNTAQCLSVVAPYEVWIPAFAGMTHQGLFSPKSDAARQAGDEIRHPQPYPELAGNIAYGHHKQLTNKYQ